MEVYVIRKGITAVQSACKLIKRLWCALSCCCFLLCSLSVESLTIYGHRGARGLAPENTLSGFHEALKHHVDAIDLDVVMTKDGVLVAYHDLTLNPDITRSMEGEWVTDRIPIKALTLEQLKTYNVGLIHPTVKYAAVYFAQRPEMLAPIPTLQEVIQDIKQSAPYPVDFQIELKTDPEVPFISSASDEMVLALHHIIEAEGVAHRTKVQAYDWRCLLLLQQLNPQVETAYLTDLDQESKLRSADQAIAGLWTGGYLLKDYGDSIPHMVKALGGTWWDAEDMELTKAQVDIAHGLGLKVAAWPSIYIEKDVNMDLIGQLIDMGVDGIITDRPDVVSDFVRHK